MPEFKVKAQNGQSFKITAANEQEARQRAEKKGVQVASVRALDEVDDLLVDDSQGPIETVPARLRVPNAVDPGVHATASLERAIGALNAVAAQSRWYDDKKAVYKVVRDAAFTSLLLFLIGLVAIVICGYIVLAALSAGR